VPHRIIFTYKHNILETKEPSEYHENIQNTIRAYRQLWNASNADEDDAADTVQFLDDSACQEAIALAYPPLLPHFLQERHGAYKGDICRIADLYLHGGYYFDVDIRVVQPVALDPNVTFATAVSSSGVFFQAFLATAPRHPILYRAFEEMMAHYEKRKFLKTIMGCRTLTTAYQQHQQQEEIAATETQHLILQEDNLLFRPYMYPQLTRQSGGWGFLCNFVVHDTHTHTVYFFSRMVGSANCPRRPTLWQ
jgi:hypothetical protein